MPYPTLASLPDAVKELPKLGEIRRGSEIGRPSKSCRYIWLECPQCGGQRWVRSDCVKRTTFSGLCHSCHSRNQIPDSGIGAEHSSWKGGRRRDKRGYILIWLASDDFFSPMAKVNSCVYEHRLVVAKSLKRCLLPWEVVHHINGIKDDNRLENLRLLPNQNFHNTHIEKQLKKLLANQDDLMKEIRMLRFENKHLRGEYARGNREDN